MRPSLHITNLDVVQTGAVEYGLAPSVHDPEFVVHDLRPNHFEGIVDAVVVGCERRRHVQQDWTAHDRVSLVRAAHPARHIQGDGVVAEPVEYVRGNRLVGRVSVTEIPIVSCLLYTSPSPRDS